VQLPFEDGKGLHVYHQYTLLSEHRDTIMTALNNHQIASAILLSDPTASPRGIPQTVQRAIIASGRIGCRPLPVVADLP